MYLEGLRITTEAFSHINRSAGGDWKQRPPEYEIGTISRPRVRLCKDIQVKKLKEKQIRRQSETKLNVMLNSALGLCVEMLYLIYLCGDKLSLCRNGYN
jgi:hypothetical protein